MQHAIRGDREVLDHIALGWQLAQLAYGILLVLGAYGVGNIAGGQLVQCQLGRVQPDTHGVVGVPANGCHAGAGNALDFVEHDNVGEGAELGEVVFVVLVLDGNHHHDGGALLLDIHALIAHRLRHLRQRRIHAVEHISLCQCRIFIDIEVDAQRHVAGRIGRIHVEHAVGTIDLKLDGRRHVLRHGFGIGARVGRGHLDLRRRDVRVLRDR